MARAKLGNIFHAAANTREIKVAARLPPFSLSVCSFFLRFLSLFSLFGNVATAMETSPRVARRFMTRDARRKYARTTLSKVLAHFSLCFSVRAAPKRGEIVAECTVSVSARCCAIEFTSDSNFYLPFLCDFVFHCSNGVVVCFGPGMFISRAILSNLLRLDVE